MIFISDRIADLQLLKTKKLNATDIDKASRFLDKVSQSLLYCAETAEKINTARYSIMEKAFLNAIREQCMLNFYKTRDRIDSSNLRPTNVPIDIKEMFDVRVLIKEINVILFHVVKNKNF